MKLSWFFHIILFPFAVLSAIAFSGQAKAVDFFGSVNGTWGKPTPGEINDYPVYIGVGTNAFTWGDPTYFKGASANQLVFEGSSFSTDAGSSFKIGDLTYRNGTVLLGTSVETASLNLNLSFNGENGVNQVVEFGFEYDLFLDNTINKEDADPQENADKVFFVNNNIKRNFSYGGNTYTLSLNGFTQDNGYTQVGELRALEGEKSTAAIFGQINKVNSSTKQVPEPGFPLVLSIAGIYLISRRKAKNSK